MKNYNLTLLTTEGWKQYTVFTEKTPEEIKEYVSSPYTKKIDVQATNDYTNLYLPLEKLIPEHPHYMIPSDKALQYFKTTNHDYVSAMYFDVKNEAKAQEKEKERKKKAVERFLDRLF